MSRHIVILSEPGWHADRLSRALETARCTCQVVAYQSLVARIARRTASAAALTGGGADVLGADGVLARFIPAGSLEQIIYRVDALHWLEDRGVVVVNSPRAIERAVDKFYATSLLHDAGLPTPSTVVCERAVDALRAVEAMGDVVIKPIFGSMGHGMVRVDDIDAAGRVLEALEQVHAVFYVQQAIEHGGRDIRAFVIGGRVVGAIERRARVGDWRTNLARGGSARVIDLPPSWHELAIRAAAAVGADYAGIDLLPSDERVYVLEVNAVPGWRGLEEATGLDVAGAIVDHLMRRIEGRVAPTWAGA